MKIRAIQPSDNSAIAAIIRAVMTDFGCDPKTTVLGEASLNTMYENYCEERAAYFIAEDENKIVGGAGIRHLDGGDAAVCELQRMFLLPEARGKGTGKKLMELCLSKAKEFSYQTVYLESFSNMKAALKLYEKSGFKKIERPMGSTGHSGCNVYMLINLHDFSQ